ncbi:MAG: signaling recognition particle receptor family protein [Gammaproteobacteria bacterium]
MFSFKKDKTPAETAKATVSAPESVPASTEPAKPGMFARLKDSLTRTRANLGAGLGNLVLGKKAIDAELLEDIETQLLSADVGVEATQAIIADLTQRVARRQLDDADALMDALRADLLAILMPCSKPLVIPADIKPFVILMVGINGAGKTTSIGKLAQRLQGQGRSVMLAAGDTFRAAAVEQLQVWGVRNNIAVIAQHSGGRSRHPAPPRDGVVPREGRSLERPSRDTSAALHVADAASVIFDGVQAAKARGIDVLIADTAGRLHTQGNLMEELKKVKRVIARQDPGAPHEVMLVVDAGTGQNALTQVQQFQQAVGVTGIILSKLDGTAKGGIIFAIAKKTGLPIRFIGVGEGIDDLREFNAAEFVNALFDKGE